jgi:hypothetical protein
VIAKNEAIARGFADHSARSERGGPARRSRRRRRPDPSDQRSAAELEEGQEETRRGNAIDWPKTIWISCRNPAKVSPNASVRPVMAMMITEVTLPTGPCIAANCSYERLTDDEKGRKVGY